MADGNDGQNSGQQTGQQQGQQGSHPQPPATSPAQAGQQGGGDPGGQPGGDPPGPVPYDRFKQINDELKQARDQLAQAQAAQKQAQEKELKDKEQWKTLAEQREAELKAERLARTRLEVATRKGVPADLAGRLQGETAEEMEKDADALLQYLKPKSGPGVPPGSSGGSPAGLDLSTMSPEEIRKNKAKIWDQEVKGR